MKRLIRLAAAVGLSVLGSIAVAGSPASAHPLGNFTTNTATRLVVAPSAIALRYVVDMAEIPALRVRQDLGVVTGVVPAAVADSWRDRTCAAIGENLALSDGGRPLVLESTSARALTFVPGQAGLSTLRLVCGFSASRQPSTGTDSTIVDVSDANFADRLGWREITAVGDGVRLTGDVAAVSPTKDLRTYPSDAATSPLRQRAVSLSAIADATSRPPDSDVESETTTVGTRGNDGLTERFQSLVAHRELTIPFAVGAALLALVLGGFHALAPGHGKTIMAAYAVSRRGRKGDILAIGGTVALTHTIGILLLGTLVTASSRVSPSGALRWTSIVSGALVVGVGITLVRSRLRGPRLLAGLTAPSPTEPSLARPHSHGSDHAHSHLHGADHSHSHSHAAGSADSRHRRGAAEHGSVVRAHPTDERFVVTSHAHGGWQHDHVLPAPGALVRRRELIVMGLAGGLVPSPSALVVLLGAIALGRIPFGLLLVVAYGVGLACTLIGAGLLMVRFESRVRRWSESRRTVFGGGLVAVANALPLVSGLAIIGAGLLLVVRSIRMA